MKIIISIVVMSGLLVIALIQSNFGSTEDQTLYAVTRIAPAAQYAGSDAHNAAADIIEPHSPHAWALMAAYPLAVQLPMWPLKLGGWDVTPQSKKWATDTLANSWGIYQRDDLLSTLASLEQSGHRSEFERLGQRYEAFQRHDFSEGLRLSRWEDFTDSNRTGFVRQHYVAMKQKSLLAFDMVRVINLARWGYLAGYLRADETWPHIMPAAILLQKTYHSWQDLGESYILGREFWGKDLDNQAKFSVPVHCAINHEGSPYIDDEWDMDLHAL